MEAAGVEPALTVRLYKTVLCVSAPPLILPSRFQMCHQEGQRPRVTFGLDDGRLSGLPIVIASDVLDFVLPVHTDKVLDSGWTRTIALAPTVRTAQACLSRLSVHHPSTWRRLGSEPCTVLEAERIARSCWSAPTSALPCPPFHASGSCG